MFRLRNIGHQWIYESLFDCRFVDFCGVQLDLGALRRQRGTVSHPCKGCVIMETDRLLRLAARSKVQIRLDGTKHPASGIPSDLSSMAQRQDREYHSLDSLYYMTPLSSPFFDNPFFPTFHTASPFIHSYYLLLLTNRYFSSLFLKFLLIKYVYLSNNRDAQISRCTIKYKWLG